MDDTSEERKIKFTQMIMSKSPEERLLMGCYMYSVSRKIGESAILAENPEIRPKGMREKIFLKFYGIEFDKKEKTKILNALK